MDSLKVNIIGDLLYYYLLYKNITEEQRVVMCGMLARSVETASLNTTKKKYAKSALLKLHEQINVTERKYSLKDMEDLEIANFLTKIRTYTETLGVKIPRVTILVTI